MEVGEAKDVRGNPGSSPGKPWPESASGNIYTPTPYVDKKS